MRVFSTLLVLSTLVLASSVEARSKKKSAPKPKHDAAGFITLNQARVEVRWTDGDSFRIKEGPYKGRSTRLTGYNTLEAYGPVHRWGTWSAVELYDVAKASAQVAAEKEWSCTTDGREDGYHRLLIDCAGLAEHMAKAGHGLAYAVDGAKADPKVLAAQADAQTHKRGMWAKGSTLGIVTSLHSVGEDGDDRETAYNRVVDTRTGQALKRPHQSRYGTCEEVCETTDDQQSCMVYVPFRKRYRSQPDCLLPRH